MNNLSNQKQIPLKWLIGLSVVLLLIILAAGLKPKGFRLTNKVSWIEDRPGIRFSKYSIAFTNPFNDSTPANISGADGFSMEIALKPASYWGRKFKFILALHNGNDSEQLIMGQWRSWFIVMKGDDYASKGKVRDVYDFMPFLFKTNLAGKWGHSEGKGGRSLNFTNKIEWAIKVRWLDF